MPLESSLSKRLKAIIPDNGYQSPTERPSTPRNEVAHGSSDFEKRLHGLTNRSDTRSQEVRFASTNGILRGEGQRHRSSASIKERIQCVTWMWFLMTMATGGVANVLHSIHYRTEWLNGVGIMFFLLNIILFAFNCVLITLRFIFTPGSFINSFTHQSESLFIPASIVSVAVILTNICQYGIPKCGPWLQSTMEVLFWIYAGVSVLGSAGVYLILWSTQTFPIHNMTPIWIFPAYPLLLVAPFASNLIDSLPFSDSNANLLAITLGAVTLQGTGFLVSLMMYGAFLYRLMSQKLPRETLRPGMFVSVGPSGFTAAGLVHLGNELIPKVLPSGWMGNDNLALMLKVLSTVVGLWVWGLSIWFFLVSLGAHWHFFWHRHARHYPRFEMTWFSFVFPNTALVTATQAIGEALDSRLMRIIGTVLAGILVFVWILVVFAMIRALWMKTLLWPEDENE